jgi:hypothetical protein
MATALDDADMEESIAGAVVERNEAKAFVRVIPLDSSSDGRAGGAVALWTTRWRISKLRDGGW